MSGATSAIRPGTLHDVRGLIRMHEQCSPLSVTRRYLSPLPVLGSRLAARLLCPPGGFSLVAERDRGIVAVTTVAPYDEDADGPPGPPNSGGSSVLTAPVRADIGQLVVDSWQRRGLGTALLLAASREAAGRGFQELVLTVHPDNPAVLPMVHATGLRARIGTRDGLTQVTVGLGHLARARVGHLASGSAHRPGEAGRTHLALAWGEC